MSELSELQRLIVGLDRYPKRRAVGLRGDFGLRWWRYDELELEVRCAALHLRALGIGRGDRVVLWGPNSPEWVAYFLALLVRGAVAVPVDTAHGHAFVARVIEEAKVRLVLHARETPLRMPHTMTVAMVTPSKIDAAHHRAAWPWVDAVGEDPALIMFSSGSTAAPRGVVLSHANLAAQLRVFRRLRIGLRLLRVRLLFVPPLSHVFGVVVGVCVPLYLGMTVFYLREPNPRHLCRVIRDNHGMVVAMVPATLRGPSRALRDAGGDQRGWGSRWRSRRARRRLLGRHCHLLVLGGARLPLADESLWRRSGLALTQGYGLTEATAIVSFSNPLSRTPGTLGRGLSSVDVTLAPDGELLVRGPGSSPGVLESGELRPLARDQDGFLPTGDLAQRDDAGRLVFIGRKHGMLVTAEGHNLFPADIEAVLDARDGVLESAVVGRGGDGGGGVYAHAWLVPRSAAAPADEDDLMAKAVYAANEQLAAHQRIHSWARWPGVELPRSPLGKLLRPQLEPVGEDQRRPSLPLARILAEADPGERVAKLAAYIAAGVPAHERELELATNLALDSLDLAQLVARIEQHVGPGLVVPFAADISLGELERVIRAHHRSPAATHHALPTGHPPYTMRWPMTWARAVIRPLLLRLWTWTAARVRVEAHASLDELRGPLIFVAQPHRQRLDVWVAALALPRRLLRHTALVTAARFEHYFSPTPATTTRQRIKHWLAYYVALPSFMPFAIVPSHGLTHAGLCRAGALLDRRYNLLGFPFDAFAGPKHPPAPGLAQLAAESGCPLVPLYFEGTDDLRWPWKRPRNQVVVHFGAPLHIPPHASRVEMIQSIQHAFYRLHLDVLASHDRAMP